MNSKNIKIGNYYRLKNSIDYGWVKVLEVKKAKQDWNNTNYIAAKCEHSVHKDDTMGFIRYFKLSDLVEV